MSTRHHYRMSIAAAKSHAIKTQTNRLLRTSKGSLLPKANKKRAAIRKKMS